MLDAILNSYLFRGLMIIVGMALVYYFLMKKKDGAPGSVLKSLAKRGATPTLDSYTINFTELARLGKIDPVIGREAEVLRLSQILSRRGKNNAILVGDPGVGKTAIVEGLAQRIVSGEVPAELKGKRVLSLDVATMLSGTKYRGEFEERAKKLVKEIEASNRSIILFIDEIHSVIQSQGTEGAINFSDILKPALARGDLQMIGATTIVEYNKYIKTDPSLERRFQPIMVNEPNEAEAITILQGVKDKYREYHKVEFTDAALKAAVILTNKKIKNRTLPDKAIDAIDEAASMVRVSHVHEAVPAILYQAAVNKYPELAERWKKIQELDRQLLTQKKPDPNLVKQRETLEKQLEEKGVLTVDEGDVEKVVEQWTKDL